MTGTRLTSIGIVLAAIVALLGGLGFVNAAGAPATAETPPQIALAAPAEVDRDAVDFAALDRRIERLMDEHSAMTGMAVGMVLDGEIVFLKGYGSRTGEEGDAVDIHTIFRWASVSKGVAGVMAAKLDSEGALLLDRPIAAYSSTLTLPENNHFSATLRDTLSHRLGIWRNAYDDKLEDGQDPDEIRRQLGELVQICPVGACWSYQNIAFDAASEAIEKVTGVGYDTALKSHLFAPLGMTRASATRQGLMADDNWAHPFNRGGREYEVDQDYYLVPAAGGVNSSILDATIWLQAQLGQFPEILPETAIETAHHPLIDTPGELRRMRDYRERLSNARYGLGWRTYDYAGRTVVGHRGGVDGYRSFILFDPERDAGIVAFWNSDTGQPHGLQFEFLDMLYGLDDRDWLELDS